MSINWQDFSILIVEDDGAMRLVLCKIFSKLGVQLYSAENGQQALNIMKIQKIHLVLSDVQMPIMDGVELLKQADAKNCELPIFLLATGHSDLTEESALSLGAVGLIHKPFNIQTLVEKTQKILLDKFAA